MIHFAQAQYLLLILLIPFLFAGYALFRRNRNRKIAKLGNPEILATLMPTRSRAKGWVRISFFAVAWFFFAIGLARPQMGAKLKENNRKGAEIMIALDVSNSMLAQDYYPNRLERAKLAISRLVDKLQGDRIGLIVFAGNSFVQLPITTDYVSAKMFLDAIDPSLIASQGTDIGGAINLAMRSFTPKEGVGRAIIIITDGENHEGGAEEAARAAAEKGMQVYVLGVGSPEGSPIPSGTRANDFRKDKDGNVIVTRLNEQMCQQIAQAGKGMYIRVDNSNSAQRLLQSEIDKLAKADVETTVFTEFDEQFMVVAWIALIVLVLELLILERKNPLFKNIRLFR